MRPCGRLHGRGAAPLPRRAPSPPRQRRGGARALTGLGEPGLGGTRGPSRRGRAFSRSPGHRAPSRRLAGVRLRVRSTQLRQDARRHRPRHAERGGSSSSGFTCFAGALPTAPPSPFRGARPTRSKLATPAAPRTPGAGPWDGPWACARTPLPRRRARTPRSSRPPAATPFAPSQRRPSGRRRGCVERRTLRGRSGVVVLGARDLGERRRDLSPMSLGHLLGASTLCANGRRRDRPGGPRRSAPLHRRRTGKRPQQRSGTGSTEDPHPVPLPMARTVSSSPRCGR